MFHARHRFVQRWSGLVGLFATLSIAALAGTALAQSCPAGPIKLIVP